MLNRTQGKAKEMPNDVDTNSFSFTLQDWSSEKSTVTVRPKQFADNPAYSAAELDFRGAINQVSNMSATGLVRSETVILSPAAVTQAAQRELKLLVRYRDTVTSKIYRVAVPGADLTAVTLLAGTDLVDLVTSPMNTFVTRFEAFVASPDGNAVEIVDVRVVGRNL